MKILYISNAAGADYLCDMIFHGLRSLFGPDVVDVNKIEFMYKGTPYPPFFTVYGNLPDIEVDRTDILSKIQNRYFDLIVYGSIQRCQSTLDLARSFYPPNRIIFLDGEDDHVISPFRGQGVYFKRELAVPDSDLLPIGFCIPKEKILEEIPTKTRLVSLLNPADRSTYIYYGSEVLYYQQYAESYFGRTMKKGGWDCCRHYEIMAAGCVPYFERLEECPERTLAFLPKGRLFLARGMCDNWPAQEELYQKLLAEVRQILREKLTTEAMAKSMLERIPK